MTKVDPVKLKTFFARASVVVNLLQSRLALPLVYPLNTRMRSSEPNSPFSDAEHLHCLSQITPLAIGFSKVTSVLKGVDALTNYSGGRVRRRFQPRENDSVVHRLHHLRPLEHKGGTINARVGLGRGWEKFNQGVTVDSPRRKFKVMEVVRSENIQIFGTSVPRKSIEKAMYSAGVFFVVFNTLMVPFALPKLRKYVGAPFLPSSRSAFKSLFEHIPELARPNLRMVDVGSGDGRLLLEASLVAKTTGLGIEMNPYLVFLSRLRLRGTPNQIIWGNAWEQSKAVTDFSPDLLTFYGRPGGGVLQKFAAFAESVSDTKPIFVASNKFPIPGWQLRQIAEINEFYIYKLHANK